MGVEERVSECHPLPWAPHKPLLPCKVMGVVVHGTEEVVGC